MSRIVRWEKGFCRMKAVHSKADASSSEISSYEDLDELAKECSYFYRNFVKDGVKDSSVFERRRQLLSLIRSFHQECETLTPQVVEAIRRFEGKSCLVLMTAHQPNLFAYSGVFRKATLNHVLAEKLSKLLNLPVVCLFGIADHDFSDDRWVRSALLPDVERRGGLLELRISLPDKMILNGIEKPPKRVLSGWEKKIGEWFERKLDSIEEFCESVGVEFDKNDANIRDNFDGFWRIVEDAYEKAKTYSDFNAFLISKIVNSSWEYGTLFFRFSESPQIFKREFESLLSNFQEYSRYVKEATSREGMQKGGVYPSEFDTLPFWYACDCGSKARLQAEYRGEALIGVGKCVRCGQEFQITFASRKNPDISKVLSRISYRSLSVPLIFLDGLKVCCYVGGIGGLTYLRQAKYVAEHLGVPFPPVVIWRPQDLYLGVGQLEALITYRRISGTFDLSQLAVARCSLEKKIANVHQQIDELEAQREELSNQAGMKKEKTIKIMKAIAIRKYEIRKTADFPSLTRKLKLLQNVVEISHLHTCIIDYAVNVGLEEISRQWITFLKKDGDLSSDVRLVTKLDEFMKSILTELGDTLG